MRTLEITALNSYLQSESSQWSYSYIGEYIMVDMDAGVKRLPIAALGDKMQNVLLVSIIIAKQTPRKVTCKSGKHLQLYFH
jgi:hypothetical protein